MPRKRLLPAAARLVSSLFALTVIEAAVLAPTYAHDVKPTNIVVIFGDDIGLTDVSAYSNGLLGFRTPNIDSIAKDGIMFTDYYGEQSCTAGRSSFITGQSGLRTGLTKVAVPGASLGIQKEDPTIAELLKPLGYATGQFGKNHLGDRNEFLPTVHGFDEFFGNLYHLNAEEEPELPDYPTDPAFRAKYGPRGVMDCVASDRDDPSVDVRFGKVGRQVCKEETPLTAERMVRFDDEVVARSKDFIRRAHTAHKPFFVWVNTTHMHFRTHAKPELIGQAGKDQSPYHDTMIDHDKSVGEIIQLLKDLGVYDDTFVMYTTDNGPHMNSWPDSAMSPFRNEKNSNWEGGYRVPAMIRWPARIMPGQVSNEIVSHLDMLPTLLAVAGNENVGKKLLEGYPAGSMTYKVHLDGYNLLPYLTGVAPRSPRDAFFYVSDEQEMVGLRSGNWKFVWSEQRMAGTMAIWAESFTPMRLSKIFNLRTDPYERSELTSNTYWDWWLDHAFLIQPAYELVSNFVATFKDYPIRQTSGSYGMEAILAPLKTGVFPKAEASPKGGAK